jgi:hypothetical protein
MMENLPRLAQAVVLLTVLWVLFVLCLVALDYRRPK